MGNGWQAIGLCIQNVCLFYEIHFPQFLGAVRGRHFTREYNTHTSACQIFASVKSTNSYIFDGIANGGPLCRSLLRAPLFRVCVQVLSANFISYCQSRSDMLLAISNKRKCTLAFLQRMQSPKRGSGSGAASLRKFVVIIYSTAIVHHCY